jgi:hypothetical protein
MFDHERSLVQRYQGRPFTLLGVSVDRRREVLERQEAALGLTWRSWWDGPGGPIARTWKVETLPSLYLIDAKGQVRFEFTGVPDAAELERRIEQLLQETDKTTIARR